MPRVTVSIPSYNKEDFIVPALESVLKQTFRDLEVLVIDDVSTDETVARIRSFMATHPEAPIRLVINERNLGVQGNGNRCMDLPETEFIARFDADDIMPPSRIEKQVAFLDAHPEIGQVGGYLQLIGAEEKLSKLPLTSDGIKAQMPIFNGISQGTSLFRRTMVNGSGERYDESGPSIGEDWLFFYKLSRHFPQGNLPEVMDLYRIHDNNISASRDKRYFMDIDRVLTFILSDLGIPQEEQALELHYWLRGQHRAALNAENCKAFGSWCDRLEEAYAQNGLDIDVLRSFKERALEQLYFHVEPNDRSLHCSIAGAKAHERDCTKIHPTEADKRLVRDPLGLTIRSKHFPRFQWVEDR